jgi:hAT family C-terminal dimerisation region
MASSVSSERAFSSAGITISKRRNRLKKDIVEALQCLKCMYHNNLIFREVETVDDEEKTMDKDLEVVMDNNEVNDLEEGFSWDQLVIEE